MRGKGGRERNYPSWHTAAKHESTREELPAHTCKQCTRLVVGRGSDGAGGGRTLTERALVARKHLQVSASATAGDHGADGLLELVQAVQLRVGRADLSHVSHRSARVARQR